MRSAPLGTPHTLPAKTGPQLRAQYAHAELRPEIVPIALSYGRNTARTTSVLSTWNKFQSGTCRSPPPSRGGTPVSAAPTRPSHQWSRRPRTGYWTVEHLNNSPKKTGYNPTKKREPEKERRNEARQTKKKTVDADGSWIPPVSSSRGRTAGCCGRTNKRLPPPD